jgi:hypothetical protein
MPWDLVFKASFESTSLACHYWLIYSADMFLTGFTMSALTPHEIWIVADETS